MKKLVKILKIALCLGMVFFTIIDIFYPYIQWPKVQDKQYTLTESQKELLEIVAMGSDQIGKWRPFIYFTTWSTIISVCFMCASWLFQIEVKQWLKNIVFSYSFVVVFIFWTTLSYHLKWGVNWFDDLVNIYEHGFIFILMVWWWFEKAEVQIRKSLGIFLIIPLAYLMLTITVYFKYDVAIYPFIHFENWMGLNWGKATSTIMSLLSILIMVFVFLGVNKIITLLANRIWKYRKFRG